MIERGRLVLPPSEVLPRAYVAADADSLLADLPGCALLREHATAGGALSPFVEYDYRAVAAALLRPADEWDRDDCGGVLNALNMLSDLAIALRDDDLAAEFDGSAFVLLQERLTFLDEGELPGALEGIDLEAIFRMVGQGVERIECRILMPG